LISSSGKIKELVEKLKLMCLNKII